MECRKCGSEMTHFINRDAGIMSGFKCPDCETETITQITSKFGDGFNVFRIGEGFVRTSGYRMSQEEVNTAIYDILKVIIHSTDNYNREVVDLNAVALLQKLGAEVRSSKESASE